MVHVLMNFVLSSHIYLGIWILIGLSYFLVCFFSTVNTYFLSKLLDEFRSQLKYKNFYTQYGIEWSNE